MATGASLEQRVTALEAEVVRLRAEVTASATEKKAGWDAIWGTFANDPIYEEAMKLGREWRESQRPIPSHVKIRKHCEIHRSKGNEHHVNGEKS